MTPRQVITMVTCWAVAPAIIAAAIALPAGTALEPVLARAVVNAQEGPAENMTSLMPGVHGGAPPPGSAAPSGGAVRYASPPPQQARGGPQPGASRQSRIDQPPQSSSGAQSIFTGMLHTAGQDPYTSGELALLALAGPAIALAGALGPAAWAATSRTTTALRAE